ncbi:MAG TPA: CPBP family intramembrane glutamic endopeptidase [Longimicrobiales bacterium]|nr:CPBP family intramembrane glutamic endopeptidase [Longimicrobiales bacterium]
MSTFRPFSRASCAVLLLAGVVGRATAQPVERDVEQPRGGSEFWIPFGSIVVPGLGQYIHGDVWPGLAYTGTALGGYALSGQGNATLSAPRDAEDQLAFEGLHLAATAGMLSAWDAFQRALPAQRGAGKYGFFAADEDLGDLLTAPLDFRFLGRWTTLADLAFTAAVTTWVLTEGPDDRTFRPYRWHDAAFGTSLSLNAAVGEEALFRGWLLPMLTQKLGGSFWLANFIQAGLFGIGHPQAEEFAVVIGAGALYSGWQTRRNDWSIREVIFQHFWYDVAVVTATLLRDDRNAVTLMPIRIRF